MAATKANIFKDGDVVRLKSATSPRFVICPPPPDSPLSGDRPGFAWVVNHSAERGVNYNLFPVCVLVKTSALR